MRVSDLERLSARQGEIVRGRARVNGELRELVLPSAIPDSEADQKLAHRYVLDDVNGTMSDSEGGINLTNNGVTSTDGDWAGDSAGDGDGTDDHALSDSPLSPFYDAIDTGAAVAFSMATTTTDTNVAAIGTAEDAGDASADALFDVRINSDSDFNSDTGNIMTRIRDGGGEDELTADAGTDNINDGSQYRVVINYVDPSDNDIDIYINQTEESGTQQRTNGPTGSYSGLPEMGVWGDNEDHNDRIIRHADAVIDDVCFFDDELTASEAQSYENPWD